jgi:3'-phosphoadenosine 5'-phosphosulfate sulfotransferase (PAPS reductase)/FAD synthetase
MSDAWALRDSNPGASDYESVPNVVPDGQGADSGGISGPLRTGTDTGRHRVDSVRPYNVRHPKPRHVAWFSCGAASAAASKIAVERWPDTVVVYCDTSRDEHPDNARFFADVERWLGTRIVRLSSKYASVEDVFEQTRYMSGIAGARCTVEMKMVPRFRFQRADDIHVFGFTADEGKRLRDFEQNNPELAVAWVLRDAGITKRECYSMLSAAGIELPAMYRLGYKNNNCIGCVKATSPAYWAKVRHDFPEVFARRASQSRELGVRLARVNGKRIFLDELPADDRFAQYQLEDISCGPECGGSSPAIDAPVCRYCRHDHAPERDCQWPAKVPA